MKTLLLFTSLFLFANSAVADNYKEKVVLENITATKIVAEKSIGVEIYKVTNKSDTQVVLCSEMGNFDRFEYSIKGNTLYLSEKSIRNERRRGWKREYEHRDKTVVKVYITEFSDFTCRNSSDIVVKDSFACSSLLISTSGSSDIYFNRDMTVSGNANINITSSSDILFRNSLSVSGNLTIYTEGSSDVKFDEINVKGNMKATTTSSSDMIGNSISVDGDFEAYLSGSSDFLIGEQTVGSFTAECSSSTDYELGSLKVTKGAMNVEMSGSSDFEIDGGIVLNSTEYSIISTSSSSSFDGREVKMEMAKVSCSGSSDLIVNASKVLDILSVASAADLYYVGNQGLDIKRNQSKIISGTIKKL